MSFVHPERFWLLGLALMLALGWVGMSGRRQRERRALGLRPKTGRWPDLLWWMAVVGLVVALAQPRAGKSPLSPLPPGRDLVLILDASRSMAAEDAVPSRMAVATESACSMIDALGLEPGNRVGVIAFAGAPVLRCGLTSNLGAARAVVRSIGAGSVRPGGTDLAAAIDLAIDSFDDREHQEGRSIVVLTDGEDLGGRVTGALERWRASKVAIYAVAIGDAQTGHPIPLPGAGLVQFEGATVLSKRQDTALEDVTRATGGVFVPLGIERADLGKIYRDSLVPREQSQRRSLQREGPRGRDVFAVPLILSLLCWLGFEIGQGGLRRARPVVILLLVGLTLGAAGDESLDEAIRRGRQFYEQRSYDRAIAEFRAAAQRFPTEVLPLYNLGASQFQQRQFEEAELSYRKALRLAGPALQAKINYALANCLVMRYEFAESVRWYDRALQVVSRSVEGERLAVDIRLNRDYVLKLMDPVDPAGKQSPDDQVDPSQPPERSQNKGQAAPPPPESGTTAGRGQGGAGGDGQESARGKSPAEQLAEAVESIRASKESRLTDRDAPVDPRSTERDW